VLTQFREKSKPDSQTAAADTAPIFVVVKAAKLVYTDEDRLAHYSGGVVLTRPQLQVKADELRAILSPQDNDPKTGQKKEPSEEGGQEQSRLEKAFADGHVEIVQAASERTRTGTSEHAEYYTDNERIVLSGGQPQMVDSKKGFTRGAELTYYVNDDRLLVSGSPQQPATGRLRRR
jgi:lipopolysaccharide export system protein LptA